jgi:hypothetical protein
VFEAFNERGEASPLRTLSRLYDHLASRIAQREALRQLIDDYRRSFANRSGSRSRKSSAAPGPPRNGAACRSC